MQFLLISSLASLALANSINTPALFRRADTITCSDGGSVCGSSCYDPQSYLCCSTAGDLCAIGTYCSTDSSNNVACCTNGENCQGAASTGLITATTVGSSASGTADSTASTTASTSTSSASSVACSNGESKCGDGCYDPTEFVCCSEKGALCASGEYCTTNSDSEAVCCAIGFNCAGAGSSTTSASPATTIGASGTAGTASTTGTQASSLSSSSSPSLSIALSSASATAIASDSTSLTSMPTSGTGTATATSGSKTSTSSKSSTATGTGTSSSSAFGVAMTAVPMYIAGAFLGIAAVV